MFLCTHNSARSQMAEGLLRAFGDGAFDAFLGGTEATHVRPLAISAVAELGIDSSHQQSTSKAEGSEAEQLAVYRQVHDAIRDRIERELLAHAK